MSSFIGCKISLVSKAQIRYEGVLYTIDPQESTVALSRVKSFGTEDRKVDRVIPARDEIYEYIIFRGSDIEDLNVCEHSKERSLLMEDSSIVKAEASVSDNYVSGNVAHGGLPKGMTQGDNHSSNWKAGDKRSPIIEKPLSNGTRSVQSKDETNFKQKIHQPVATTKQSHPNNDYKKSQTKKYESYNNGHSDNKHEQSKLKVEHPRKTQEKYESTYYNYDYEYNYDNEYKYSGSNYCGTADYTSNNYEKSSSGRSRRSNYRQDQYYSSESNKLRGFESSEYNRDYSRGLYYGYKHPRQSQDQYYERGSNKPHRRNNNPDNSKQKDTSFKEDYDFESANAIIAVELANMHMSQDKKEVKEDAETVNDEGDLSEELDAAYYDKNKSFFDKISSEMIDRANGKVVRPMNRKDERKMNVETFGVAEAVRTNGKWINPRGSGGSRFNGRGRGYSYVDAAYRGSVSNYKRDMPSHKSSGRGHPNGRRTAGSNGTSRDDFR